MDDGSQELLLAFLVGKPKWAVQDIPDLSGKTAIVTGGSSGIGKEIVKALLARNAARVYIASRNQQSAEETIADLYEQTGRTALFLRLDLADLSSVKAAAEHFVSQEKNLHILFNNGGICFPPVEQTTPAGHDLSFGVNALGHFYLTQLLIPTLLRTFRETGENPRVVNVASSSIYLGMFNIKTLKDGPERQKLTLMNLYGQSKIANVLFSTELAKRYGDRGVISIAVNPGNVKSDLDRYVQGSNGTLEKFILHVLQMYPTEWGALTPLYAGTNPEVSDSVARLGRARTFDPKLSEQLWDWMEEEVKSVF
ncbi:NAD(P)-binding protein [Hymenopellis radicata]|nr:NAD(P)-binding protein [Hymenopellis radicata]